MASCALAASGWPRASAIGRRGVGALGPRSRWDRGDLTVWESGLVAACRLGVCVMSSSRLPDLAGSSYRSVTRSWPCCVWSFAGWNRGFSCPTWQLVGLWKRVSRNRRFHQAPGRDPLPSPPSGGAVISTLSRALPARLIERAPSHGAGGGGDMSSQPPRSNPRGRTRGKRGVWAETETRIKP